MTRAEFRTFVQDHGEKLYRRSIYTYIKRTVAPPALEPVVLLERMLSTNFSATRF